MKRTKLFLLCGCLLIACQQSAQVGEDSDSVDNTDTVTTTTPTDSTDDTAAGDTATADTATLDTESTSDTEPLPEPVENEWIFIEGGTFEMGDEKFPDNKASAPVHMVNVPSFEMQKTEVTVFQYQQCVDASNCSTPNVTLDLCAPQWHNNNWLKSYRLNYPINCINYLQAGDYCQWLGGRLSSEAEWEYAASGGGQGIDFPWGDDTPTCDLVAYCGSLESAQECWSCAQPVCGKPLGNSYHGLCDLAGNYGEWVADRVDIQWGYDSAPTDGSAWIYEDVDVAVVRGGGYDETGGGQLVVWGRGYQEITSDQTEKLTIRCVRDVQ